MIWGYHHLRKHPYKGRHKPFTHVFINETGSLVQKSATENLTNHLRMVSVSVSNFDKSLQMNNGFERVKYPP